MADPIRKKVKDVLLSLENIEAGAVVRKDGLLIASSLPEEIDRKGVWAASAKIVNATEACSDELGKGELRQIILETEKGRIISLSAGKDAFLLCVAGKDAPLGQLLLSLSSAADEVEKILR
jgi:hypothetical protein